MDLAARFRAYMRDFEETWRDGDWTRIRAHVTDDFVHERDARPLSWFRDEGAEVALPRWREEVMNFDKQFDHRIFVPKAPPQQHGAHVRFEWVCLFILNGIPALVDEGTEIAEFRLDRMAVLRGEYHRDAVDRMLLWSRQYGHRVPQVAAYFRAARGAGSSRTPSAAPR